MANEFVRIAKEMTARIEELGPNPLKMPQKSSPEFLDKEKEA